MIVQMKYKCHFTNVNTRWNPSPRLFRNGIKWGFKHVKGKNDTAAFLPNTDKKGGTFRTAKHENDKFLTEEQAEFVYKRVNAGKGINTKTIQQNMIQKGLVATELDNTYQKAILAEVNKKKDPTQIEEWSILSDHVKYITYNRSVAFHKLNIDLLNYGQNKDLYKELKEKELLNASVNFGRSPEKLKADYLDVYEGVYAEVISTDRFDEDTDLSTTNVAQVNMTRNTEV